MNKPSSSKLPILKHCAHFLDLPWTDSDSEYAHRGRELHKAVEQVLTGQPIDIDPEFKEYAESLDLMQWMGRDWAFETKLALNPWERMGRFIGAGNDRDYSKAKEDEIPGTCDAWCFNEKDSVLRVVDWKFGYNTPDVADNWQLLCYVAALWFYVGPDVAVVHIVSFDDDGSPEVGTIDIFPETITDFIERLCNRIFERGERPNPGDHCQYCPGKLACSAYVDTVAVVANHNETGLGDELARVLPNLRPEHYAIVGEAVKRLKGYTKALEQWQAATIQGGPVETPQGVFEQITTDGNESLDVDIAAEVLSELLPENANAAIEVKITKASIKRAIKATGKAVAPTEKEIVDAIRARGGVSCGTKKVVVKR